MSHCVLGTNRQDYHTAAALRGLHGQSQPLYAGAEVHPFHYQEDPQLAARLEGLSVAELGSFEISRRLCPSGDVASRWGAWCCLRSAGRCAATHLPDDEPTRYLLRAYMLSAYAHCRGICPPCWSEVQPAAAVIFNGIMYPEAAARWVARRAGHAGLIAHEVGFQRFSAFFTDGEATAYPIHIPRDFELTAAQNARLDAYLEKRFQGQFTMAGIQFWPEMRGLDEAFLDKAAAIPPDRAGLYQRDLRHQPGARQPGLPAYVCLAGSGAGDHPQPPGYPVCHPRPPG